MNLKEVFESVLPDSKIGILVTFAICIAFFEALAQNSLKYYSDRSPECSNIIMCIGVVGYIFVAFLLLTSYNFVAMSKMNLIWSCISIVTACSLGSLIHNEDFDKYTASSVALAITSIYVAHLGEQENAK